MDSITRPAIFQSSLWRLAYQFSGMNKHCYLPSRNVGSYSKTTEVQTSDSSGKEGELTHLSCCCKEEGSDRKGRDLET